MENVVYSVLVCSLLGVIGLVASTGQADAAYTSKGVSCPSNSQSRTCTGQTARGLQSGETYYAIGNSNTTRSIPEAFAWTRGTDMYHRGEILQESVCQFANGTSCTTHAIYLCDVLPPPAGCGPQNYTRWFATTWSWFKPVATEYAVFTATNSGADLAQCWVEMNCA